MHGRHPHQRGKGHNAAHKTDLRQPKRARICATDCGSPHQTSVPVSCGRSPQLVSHVTVSIVYASMPGIPQEELKPPRRQTKQNTTPNTHQRRNPRRSRHAAYDKILCELLSTSKGKYPFPKAIQQVLTDALCAAPLDLGDWSVLSLKRSYSTTVTVTVLGLKSRTQQLVVTVLSQ